MSSALEAGRRMAERRMTDTCRITTAGTGDRVFDETNGRYTNPASVEVYGPDVAPHFGKCRLKSPALVNPFQASGAVDAWQVEESVLSLPADAPSIEPPMIVEYVTAPDNASLEGRLFGVVGPHRESQATAQRVLVRETVGVGA